MAVGVKVGGPVTVTASAQGKQGSARISVVARVGRVGAGRAGHGERGGGAHQHAGGQGIRRTGRRIAGPVRDMEQQQCGGGHRVAGGAVTGVTVGGPVTITATIEGLSGAAQVTVVEAAVATVTVSPPTSSIAAGSDGAVERRAQGRPGQRADGTGGHLEHVGRVACLGVQYRAGDGPAAGRPGDDPGHVGGTERERAGDGDAGSAVQGGVPGAAAPRWQRASTITPPVQVEIQNILGGRVTNSSATVTLSLADNPARPR